jgi:hypothetical protein
MENMKYAFVGCSSSNKITNLQGYCESAKKVGTILSNEGYGLVFGACNYGLMGEVYKTMKSNGSQIIGVAPSIYKDDFKTLTCDEEYVVDTTNERISLMVNKSDVLIFLAGGTGTLEELIIAIELKRRKEIDKTLIVFDEFEFYAPLLQQVIAMDEGKFSNNVIELFNYVTSPEELVGLLRNKKPAQLVK